MIVEERVYTLRPGQVGEYLRLYREFGLDTQVRILGRMVGYYSTDVGPLNQIVHLWAYSDYADRARRRAELGRDPTWSAYVPKIRPLILNQESKILIPTPFSPTAGPTDE